MSTSRRSLKWLTIMAAMEGVGAKQEQDTITMSICIPYRLCQLPLLAVHSRIALLRVKSVLPTAADCITAAKGFTGTQPVVAILTQCKCKQHSSHLRRTPYISKAPQHLLITCKGWSA